MTFLSIIMVRKIKYKVLEILNIESVSNLQI